MTGIIFSNTVRTSWKQMLMWGIGMGVLGFYITVIASDVDILEGYAGMLETIPPAMLQIFGFSDADMLMTIEGFIGSAYVLYAMLILSIYGIATGFNITLNEEDDGIMDTLLALPISRTQVVIEKVLAYSLTTLGIIVLCIAFPLAAIVLSNAEVDTGKIVLSILSIYPGLMLIIGVTSLIGTTVKRRTTAIGLSAVFVIGSYVLNILGGIAGESIVGTLQGLSYFYHTDGQAIILDTYNPLTSLMLIAVTIGCIGLAIMMFNRRDIGV